MTWQNVIGFPGLNIRSILLNTTDFRRWWSSVALRSALKEKQNGREINMVALLIMNLIKLYRQRIINIFIMALIYIQVKKTGANSSTYNTNTYIQIPFRTPNNRRLRERPSSPPKQSQRPSLPHLLAGGSRTWLRRCLRRRPQEGWVDSSHFSCQEGVHAEEKVLEIGRALQLLRERERKKGKNRKCSVFTNATATLAAGNLP